MEKEISKLKNQLREFEKRVREINDQANKLEDNKGDFNAQLNHLKDLCSELSFKAGEIVDIIDHFSNIEGFYRTGRNFSGNYPQSPFGYPQSQVHDADYYND